jgi:hypothetical protein
MMHPIAPAALTSEPGPLERQKDWRVALGSNNLDTDIGTATPLACRLDITGK